MIVGIGVDLVDLERFESKLTNTPALVERIFTETERAYCLQHKNSVVNFAGRWAAKEAIMKCLGTGFTKGVGWHDLEIINLPTGRPVVTLTGHALSLATECGISQVLISISHGKDYAVATAIAEGKSD